MKRLNIINNKQIENKFIPNKNDPYIIKGFSKDWVAQKTWSFEFLKELNPNLEINTIYGNAATGDKSLKSTLLSEYIDSIILGKETSYLSTFHLFKKFPFLEKDIIINEIKKISIIRHLLAWIGPANSITGFHVDWSNNINVQIAGEKMFYLVSPKFNKNMYISNRFERISNTSMIDIKKYDDQKYPLLKNAEIISFVLEPSDAIFIPRGWWHYVESKKPSINVSIHYWSLMDSFRDLPIELTKVFLHDIGLYKKNNCACHEVKNGIRIRRG
jgi:lysine-specific demethylase 8